VHYATCQIYSNTHCLGMTSDAPPTDLRIEAPEDGPPLQPLDLGQSSLPWYRRGLIGFFWNLFTARRTMQRVMDSTMNHVKNTRENAEAWSRLPMAELLPRYLEATHSEGNDSYAKVRPPATGTAIAEAQARLGTTLPESVTAFYQASEGLDWHNALRNAPLPRLAELRRGRDFDPPLSQRFRTAWEEDGRDEGDPEALQATADDLAGMFGGNAIEIPFAATDEMVALSRPDGADVLLLTLVDLPQLPRYSVIEAEGIHCTWYRDLPRWMAGQAAMFGGLKEMAQKYSK